MTPNTTRLLSRRDALKLLGAGAGAAVLANLPSKWSTPALTAGVLPAHAQTSYVGCPRLGLTATTDFASGTDIDITLLTPGGFLVTPKPVGANQGTTDPLTGAFHSGDMTNGGIETITVPTGNLANGVWTITVTHISGGLSPTNISIDTGGGCSLFADPNLGPGGEQSVVFPALVENCVVAGCSPL